MSLSQNPNQSQQPTSQERELMESVRYLDEQALKWKNILTLRSQIKKAAKEETLYNKLSAKLSAEQATNARNYAATAANIEQLEKDIQKERDKGTRQGDQAAKNLERTLRAQKALHKDLAKTEGGYIEAQSQAAAKKRGQLEAERNLIRSINKERGVGARIADLFRSKEDKQRQLDIARARAGGGTQTSGAGGGGTGGGKGALAAAGVLGGLGVVGLIIMGIKTGLEKLKAGLGAIGSAFKGNITAPLKDASNLVSGGIGGGYGVGGGAVSGAGATSLLGGLQNVASQIPFIGGLVGGLIGAFKGVVDLVLGLDQGLTNFARNLGISKDQAKGIKEEFRGVAKASGNIVINETRLMESQAEITKALGIRSKFSNELLTTNIELKEIAGVELETRKALIQTSIMQNKDANVLTKSILAQTKAFEFQTGVAFEYRQILGEASKQAGVLGLTFAKYPERLTKALMTTKAMGMELKQLDGIAGSFLDFENSISKEMEAQVLLGRDINLTTAREAALNNDLVTLAKEITNQVGTSGDFLKLNRVRQDAIAEAVGMTRDSLADVLKQQEYYKRLGADNLKNAQAELKALKEKGLTQTEISKKIGEDAYNYITQTSTAERLAELMNRIKTIFIEFVEKSGILDFITKPEKIQGFVSGLIERLAGAVNMIGSIIAGTLEVVGDIAGLFSSEREASLKGLASQVRAGSAAFAGGLQGAAATIGGTAAPSISSAVQAGARTPAPEGYVPGPVAPAAPGEQTTTVYVMMDGEVVAKQVAIKAQSSPYYKQGR